MGKKGAPASTFCILLRLLIIAGSRAALIGDSLSSSSSERGRKTLLVCPSQCSEDENYATLYDVMPEQSESLEQTQSILAAQVDSSGAMLQVRERKKERKRERERERERERRRKREYGRIPFILQMRNCGASVLVPEEALDDEAMIFLAVSEEKSHRPPLPRENSRCS